MVQLTEYGRQVAFLEAHEEELTEFVKSKNSKIESVQFNWDSTYSDVVGNGTPQGGGDVLGIYGYVNGDSKLDFSLFISTDINKLKNIEQIYFGSAPDLEEGASNGN